MSSLSLTKFKWWGRTLKLPWLARKSFCKNFYFGKSFSFCWFFKSSTFWIQSLFYFL